MERETRTRLVSVGVLFLVFVAGFLLGMAWDRTDGALEAGEAGEEGGTVVATDPGSEPDGREGETAERPRRDDPAGRAGPGDRDRRRDGGDDRGGRSDRDGRRLIVHEVGITETQEARVDSIVDLHGNRVRALRREMEEEYDPRFRALRREMEEEFDPRFRDVLLRTRRSIRSILTEEQAVRYDSLLAEHDRKEAERKRDRR